MRNQEQKKAQSKLSLLGADKSTPAVDELPPGLSRRSDFRGWLSRFFDLWSWVVNISVGILDAGKSPYLNDMI